MALNGSLALLPPDPHTGLVAGHKKTATTSAYPNAQANQAPAQSPLYFAVIYTDPWAPHDKAEWEREVALAATLAEENPGYAGYDVHVMEGGREYAMTYWQRPEDLRQWKRGLGLLVHNRALLEDMFGDEGCHWPWL